MTGVLLGGGLAAVTATAASADAPKVGIQQTCYGGAVNYKAPSGYWPSTDTSKYVKMSGRCADINVKVNYNRKVAVCWDTGYCQQTWTQGYKGKWVVVGKGDPQHAFRLIFSGSNDGTGKVAY